MAWTLAIIVSLAGCHTEDRMFGFLRKAFFSESAKKADTPKPAEKAILQVIVESEGLLREPWTKTIRLSETGELDAIGGPANSCWQGRRLIDPAVAQSLVAKVTHLPWSTFDPSTMAGYPDCGWSELKVTAGGETHTVRWPSAIASSDGQLMAAPLDEIYKALWKLTDAQ
jgi:hypothetical protein